MQAYTQQQAALSASDKVAATYQQEIYAMFNSQEFA